MWITGLGLQRSTSFCQLLSAKGSAELVQCDLPLSQLPLMHSSVLNLSNLWLTKPMTLTGRGVQLYAPSGAYTCVTAADDHGNATGFGCSGHEYSSCSGSMVFPIVFIAPST